MDKLETRRKKFEEDLADEQNKHRQNATVQVTFTGAKKTPLDFVIEKKENSMGRVGQYIRISSEFFSAILVGIALGYASDRLLGTNPWGMIIFLILGFCAGVLNLFRYTNIAQKNDQ